MLDNRFFFNKKDVINITPLLDIMLVLFVVIILVASFRDKAEIVKNQRLINELIQKIENLNKINTKIRNKYRTLEIKNIQLLKDNDKIKNFVNKFTVKVVVYDNFVTINGVKYSIEDFKYLIKNEIIKKIQFYYFKDRKAINNYKMLNQFLNTLGWDTNFNK